MSLFDGLHMVVVLVVRHVRNQDSLGSASPLHLAIKAANQSGLRDDPHQQGHKDGNDKRQESSPLPNKGLSSAVGAGFALDLQYSMPAEHALEWVGRSLLLSACPLANRNREHHSRPS